MENNTCNINGIMYHDPTGDLVRITSLINSIIRLVNDTSKRRSAGVGDVKPRRSNFRGTTRQLYNPKTVKCFEKEVNMLWKK